MSLLDQLWDESIAGPRPDSGLKKLRKHPTFNLRSLTSNKEQEIGSPRSVGELASPRFMGDVASPRQIGSEGGDDVKVTRSIMIMRPPGSPRDTPPASPAGSSPPVSPFAGGGGKEAFRFRRKSASFAFDKASGVGPRSPPPPYDL